jgi:hypothetical protein
MPSAPEQAIGGILNSPIFKSISALFLPIVALVVVLSIGYVLWKYKPFRGYPVTVKINRWRKDGKKFITMTKAGREGKKGEEVYNVKDFGKIQAQSLGDIDLTNKGKEFLELDEIESGRLVPHSDEKPESNLSLTPDVENYVMWQMRQNAIKFALGGFWNKYAQTITMVLVLFGLALLYYVTMVYGINPQLGRVDTLIKNAEALNERNLNIQERFLTMTEYYIGKFEEPIPTNTTGE